MPYYESRPRFGGDELRNDGDGGGAGENYSRWSPRREEEYQPRQRYDSMPRRQEQGVGHTGPSRSSAPPRTRGDTLKQGEKMQANKQARTPPSHQHREGGDVEQRKRQGQIRKKNAPFPRRGQSQKGNRNGDRANRNQHNDGVGTLHQLAGRDREIAKMTLRHLKTQVKQGDQQSGRGAHRHNLNGADSIKEELDDLAEMMNTNNLHRGEFAAPNREAERGTIREPVRGKYTAASNMDDRGRQYSRNAPPPPIETIEMRSRRPVKAGCKVVTAPPGPLGILIKETPRGLAVDKVKHSCVADFVPGDMIIEIDGRDVSRLDIDTATAVITSSSDRYRQITIMPTISRGWGREKRTAAEGW